jgi:hypothetical protein
MHKRKGDCDMIGCPECNTLSELPIPILGASSERNSDWADRYNKMLKEDFKRIEEYYADGVNRKNQFINAEYYDKVKAKLDLAIEVLEKIADPTKRDHSESDVYTKCGCVMHMATEVMEKIKK